MKDDIQSLRFSRRIWLTISIVSGIIALLITSYYLLKYPNFEIYGEQFIMDEWVPFKFVQFKPITLMFFFIFTWWGSLLQFIKPKLSRINKNWINFAIIILFLIFFTSIYELFFNFTLWGALMAISNVTDPDILYNRFPNPSTPVSLVYATKIIILLFSISAYSIYYLHTLDKKIGGRKYGGK